MESAFDFGNCRVAPKIPLPYIGDTSLDVIIFVGTALWYRVYQWHRDALASNQVESTSVKGGKGIQQQQDDHVHHRSTIIKPHKDAGLYEFIDLCVERKKYLRKVGDPEAIRRDKVKRILLEAKTRSHGHLGLSPEKLVNERERLHPAQSLSNLSH